MRTFSWFYSEWRKKLQYLQYQIGSIKLAVVKLILENSLTYYVVKIHRYTFSHPKKTHNLIAHNWKWPGFIPIHWRNFKNINQKWGLKKIRVLQHQSFFHFFVHCKHCFRYCTWYPFYQYFQFLLSISGKQTQKSHLINYDSEKPV